MIVTIDGPAGAGKTTAARILAERLGFEYLDTGAMYRAFALYIKEKGISPDDVEGIREALNRVEITFDGSKVLLNGEDVTERIRTPEIDRLSSVISTIKDVRNRMAALQRRYADDKNIICEGRDMGSYVFPEADVKFYMDCDLLERARRRQRDYLKKGIRKKLDEIVSELEERDRRDREREFAPLVKPDGAIYIDTTGLDIEREIDIMIEHIRRRMR